MAVDTAVEYIVGNLGRQTTPLPAEEAVEYVVANMGRVSPAPPAPGVEYVLAGDLQPEEPKYIKVWSGSAWVDKPLRYWNGVAWITARPTRYWNGEEWVDHV